MSMKILLVEDEKMTRISLTGTLRKEGYDVVPCPDGTTGISALEADHFDVVLTDLNLPGSNGLAILARCRELRPETKVVIMTAFASTETAVEALRLGAHDYMTKPFRTDEVLVRLANIARLHEVVQENIVLKRNLAVITERAIIGDSPAMVALGKSIDSVAPGEFNILIEGPSGTGKELVAKAIHARSGRHKGPLVSINCAAIPETLMESELFGHRKGAFTGADRNHTGYFERAAGGSLFIDDIDDLPLNVQVKLLRVIQERVIEPVGGDQPVAIDIRLIAATKVNLITLATEGRFREDLYYRLNVINLKLPTLAERKEDIPALVYHFAQLHGAGPNWKLPRDRFSALMGYHWPGNVRELENVVVRMIALPEVGVEELFDAPLHSPSSQSLGNTPSRQDPLTPGFGSETDGYRSYMEKCEDELLQWALKKTSGNISAAAKLLDLPRSTLRSKLEKN